MSTKSEYLKNINKINTLTELEELKNQFINECEKRANRIKVSNLLSECKNFCGSKSMFESLAHSLMSKKDGKKLINKYVKTIKENKSLKTIYAFYEGLRDNETPELKKTYITEALSITKPIQYNEYVKGVGDIIGILSESFKILGDEFVLENIKPDNKSISLDESLVYLSTTKKNIKNLNEYFSHVNKVSNYMVENTDKNINIDLSLDEIVSEMKNNMNESGIDSIFETKDKEKAFLDCKESCLRQIETQKNNTTDVDVLNKLNEIESKLKNKHYVYETFTKDMFYMKDLQEVLK